MKKLFLHIGMFKSGSSAIQAFLLLNANALKEKGFYSPDNYEFNQPFQTCSGNAYFLWKKFEENKIDEIKTYVNNICDENYSTILSSEHLFGIFSNAPELFFNLFQDLDLYIICYVRRQDNLHQSNFNQAVKNSNIYDFGALVRGECACDFSVPLLHSLRYIDAERIIVRPYEACQFRGGNIYTDFLNCIGLKLDDSFLLPNEHVNPSLNCEAMLFRMFLNESGIDRFRQNEKIIWNKCLQEYSVSKSFGKPFQDHQLLSAGQRIDIIRRYEEGNSRLAQTFLKRDDGVLFFDDLPDDSKSFSLKNELNENEMVEMLSFIYDSNNQLVISLFRYLFKCPNYTATLIKKRNCYLAAIRKVLLKKGSRSILSEFKKGARGIKLMEKLSAKTTEICTINNRNFIDSTFNYSQHVIDGGISADDKVVVLNSVGRDPYFEIKLDIDTITAPIWVRAVLEPPETTLFQVFYQTKSESRFTEQKSVECHLLKKENDVTLLIGDRDFNGKLRIDPGRSAGEYKIVDLKVRSFQEKKFSIFR